MKRVYIFFFFLLAVPARLTHGGDAVPNSEAYRIRAVKATGVITLDGKLNESDWLLADKAELHFEISPGENLPAKVNTEFRVLYTSDMLYISAICHDADPGKLRASLTDRDRIWDGDFAGFFLDTYGDNQRVYEIFANPLGVQADAMKTSNNEDESFDLLWYSGASVSDTGYVVEMGIPFRSLKFSDDAEKNWNIVFYRNYPRDSRYQIAWVPLDRNNPCLMCQSGRLTGITGITSQISVEVLPYAVGYQNGELTDYENSGSPWLNNKANGRVGGGFKISPSNSLTIQGVINPDFSQIESDAQQISVNSSFALFYPERRPFFLEGIELYQSMLQTVYSRMVNNPLAAAKVNGKAGAFSFGVLSAYDRNSPFLIPGDQGSSLTESDERSISNILRGRYDFGSEDYAGVLINARNLSGGHNYNAGVDWNYLFGTNWYLKGQLVYSHTRELNKPSLFDATRKFGNTRFDAAFNGEQYSGFAGTIMLQRQAKYHFMEVVLRDKSPTFQSHTGFINMVNSRSAEMEQGMLFYPEGNVVERLNLFTRGGIDFGYNGFRRERWLFTGMWTQLKGQVFLFAGYLPFNEEFYNGARFTNLHKFNFNFNARPMKEVSFFAYGEIGRIIYRDDNPKLGTGHFAGLEIGLKPTASLQSDFSYNRARLSDDVSRELYYDGYILRNVTNYQFTAQSSLRMITEYNSFDASISLFPLFSYKLNPFTIFYAGTSNGLQEEGGTPRHRFYTTSRQYFIKLQYLWSN